MYGFLNVQHYYSKFLDLKTRFKVRLGFLVSRLTFH